MLPQVHFKTSKRKTVRRLAIFGATGDVTARMLFPALANLAELSRLPRSLSVLAVGRREWTTRQFRRHLRNQLKNHSINLQAETYDRILSDVRYRRVQDLGDQVQVEKALGSSASPTICYLALPPSTFPTILETFNHLELHPESQVVFEKPFGEDLRSCKELNQMVHKSFPEPQVYRIDHFLGKQTVRNILDLRFANRFFEPIWNNHHIERVEITWDETLALEGRASYYDSAGALRDMIQNHLLQLLCLISMEPPITFSERDFRDRKVEVLRAVRRLSAEEVKRHSVRARYDSGQINGRKIPAYVQEKGVNSDRNTETFARVTFWIDNWRWSGVPFTLRTGKALAPDKQEIAIYFRPVSHLAFNDGKRLCPNIVRFQMNPDTIAMSVNLGGLGDSFQSDSQELAAELTNQTLPPYGHLLLDVLNRDTTMFIRSDEAEELWKIVEPVMESWKGGDVPLGRYPAGSEGPQKFSPTDPDGLG